MSQDAPAKDGMARDGEPAALGVDHVLELIAPACELTKLLANRIFRQLDTIGLAAPHFIGSRGIGCQQPCIRGVGLGFAPTIVR